MNKNIAALFFVAGKRWKLEGGAHKLGNGLTDYGMKIMEFCATRNDEKFRLEKSPV